MKKILSILVVLLAILLTIVSAGCLTTEISLVFHVDGYQNPWDEITFDGKTLNLPSNPPEKDGYEFKGWYFDKGTWKQPVSINGIQDMSLQKTIDIYAYYAPKNSSDYKVVFVSGANDVQSSIYSNGLIQRPTDPVKENYIFDGWYRSQNYYPEDKWIFDEDSVYDFADKDNSVTLYANWNPVKTGEYYLDDYSAVKGDGHISDVYLVDDKLYIVCDIAKVKGNVVAVLTDTIENYGGGSLSVNSETEISDSITEAKENTWSHTASHNFVNTNEMQVSLDLTFFLSGEYRHVWTTEDGTEDTSTYSDSESTTQSYATKTAKTLNLDLNDFPYGKWYRYVVKGDTVVKQIFEYDLNTGTITGISFDTALIKNSLRNVLEYCNDGEYFEIPSNLNPMAEVKKIDVSELFEGSGTSEDPYLIYTADDLLLSILDSDKYYKLMNDIDLSNYSWAKYTKKPEHLVTGEFSVIYPSSTTNKEETVQSDSGSDDTDVSISSPAEFMKIYENLNGNYRLTSDIDLSGYTIPEYTEFTGVLDGGKHTIYGKSSGNDIVIQPVKFENKQYYGLFSQNSGTIKNLTLSGFSIQGDTCHSGEWVYAGCIAGKNNANGIISNVNVRDSTINCNRLYSSIGMITGLNDGTINNCAVKGGIVMGNGDGGGIAGQNTNLIDSCSVVGNGAGSSDAYDTYKFLYFYRVNNDGGQSRSWGGISGYATESSKILNSNVNELFIYCYFSTGSGAKFSCNIGYLVGHNEGLIDKACSVGTVSQKRNGDYSQETKQYYLDNDGSNGYVGLNTGQTPW